MRRGENVGPSQQSIGQALAQAIAVSFLARRAQKIALRSAWQPKQVWRHPSDDKHYWNPSGNDAVACDRRRGPALAGV